VVIERVPGKESLKQFLALVFIFSAGRCVYFVSWPFLHSGCDSASQQSGDTLLWSIFGTLPAAIFLTAFSVNITTLAKIYFSVTSVSQMGLKLNTFCLILFNLVIYGLLLAWYCLPNDDTDSLFNAYLILLSTMEFVIAALYLFYATLLYLRMTIRPNPMLRLFRAAIVCFICFCVKSIFIIVLALIWDGEYPPPVLVIYPIVSEIIPLLVMFIIFETSGKRDRGQPIGSENGKQMSEKFAHTSPPIDSNEPDPVNAYQELPDDPK